MCVSHIYLSPFLRYSDLANWPKVGQFSYPLYLRPPFRGVPFRISYRDWVTKTQNDEALRHSPHFNDTFSRFDTIPACDGRTDGQTDGIAVSISHVASTNEWGYVIEMIENCTVVRENVWNTTKSVKNAKLKTHENVEDNTQTNQKWTILI